MRVEGSSVQYSVNRVDVEGQKDRTVWKIDSSLAEVEELEAVLQGIFPVATHSVAIREVTEKRVPVAAPAAAPIETVQPKPAEAKPEAQPEPAPEMKPEPQPEAKPAEAKPEAQPEPAPETKPEPQPEAKPAEAKPEAQPEPAPEMKPEPQPEAKPAEAKPEVQPEPAPETKPEPQPEAKPATEGTTRRDLPAATMLAMAGDGDWLLALADDATEPAKPGTDAPATPPAENPVPTDGSAKAEAKSEPAEAPATNPSAPSAETTPAGGEQAAPAAKPSEIVHAEATLDFDYRINGETVLHEVMEAAQAVDVLLTEEDVTVTLNAKDLANNPDWTIQDSLGYKEWIVTVAKDRVETQKILDQMAKKMADSPVWSTASKIGGKVAGDTRDMALVALAASWVAIVIYIWIRFQKVVFGLAAVIALIHDVLVSIGAVAISYWLAGFLGFLEIQEFKVSLTVVVAFLTIIGYSVNDTIVVFDRVREVRGKSPHLTEEMVNLSVNQTLARTLLTGLCTIINTVILFAIGGEGIHAFAYTLFIGFVSGTYSSIYVASPFVLWLAGGKPAARPAKS